MIKFFPFQIVLLLLASIHAQNAIEVVSATSGSTTHMLDAISRITFSSTDMNVEGVGSSYVIDDIERIVFKEQATQISQDQGYLAEQIVSPKISARLQSYGASLSLMLAGLSSGTFNIALYNLAGRLIASQHQVSVLKESGSLHLNLRLTNGTHLSAGLYTLRLDQNGFKTITKTFLQ